MNDDGTHCRDIRAEAVARGLVDPARADAARKDMLDAVQAHASPTSGKHMATAANPTSLL